jgi:hypothetical protein
MSTDERTVDAPKDENEEHKRIRWLKNAKRAQRKQKTPSRRSSRELEDAFRSTRKPTILDYEELKGLSDSGPRDCAHGVYILG